MNNSEYFFRCLHGDWQEVTQREVMLDFMSAPWCIFRHWLETDIVSSEPPPFGNKDESHLSAENSIAAIERLTQAWTLGDYLLAPQFQNDIIDELISAYQVLWRWSHQIPWVCVKYTCQNSLLHSPLRKVAHDLIHFAASINIFTPDSDVWTHVEDGDFTASMLRVNAHGVLVPVARQPAPWNRHPKYYHIKPRVDITRPPTICG